MYVCMHICIYPMRWRHSFGSLSQLIQCTSLFHFQETRDANKIVHCLITPTAHTQKYTNKAIWAQSHDIRIC